MPIKTFAKENGSCYNSGIVSDGIVCADGPNSVDFGRTSK